MTSFQLIVLKKFILCDYFELLHLKTTAYFQIYKLNVGIKLLEFRKKILKSLNTVKLAVMRWNAV